MLVAVLVYGRGPRAKHCLMISLKLGRFSGLFSASIVTYILDMVVVTDGAEGCVSYSQIMGRMSWLLTFNNKMQR